MLYLSAFFLELLFLFFLSTALTKQMSAIVHSATGSSKIMVFFLSFLFLPGTIVHELSHFLMAVIMRVPAGKFTLFPKASQDSIVLGSVAISHTDPVRRFFIGAAPFITGNLILFFGISQLLNNNAYFYQNPLFAVLAGYAVFTVSNTMFASRKDMEGAFELLLLIGLIAFLCYLIGIRLDISAFLDNQKAMLIRADYVLLVPIIIDLALLSGVNFLGRIFK